MNEENDSRNLVKSINAYIQISFDANKFDERRHATDRRFSRKAIMSLKCHAMNTH